MEILRRELPLRPIVFDTTYEKVRAVGESSKDAPPTHEMTITGRWVKAPDRKILVGFRLIIIEIDAKTLNVDCTFWPKLSASGANRRPGNDEEVSRDLYTLPLNMLHKLRQMLAVF
jgi:hypothetical protein